MSDDALKAENDKLRAELAEARAEIARLRRLLPAKPLRDEDVKIGTRVAAKIRPNVYALAEVTDVFTDVSDPTRHVYALRRLDNARKGLSPKPAAELFPPDYAT